MGKSPLAQPKQFGLKYKEEGQLGQRRQEELGEQLTKYRIQIHRYPVGCKYIGILSAHGTI